MGWTQSCRLSVFGVAAVLGMMILFVRGPLDAGEKKADQKLPLVQPSAPASSGGPAPAVVTADVQAVFLATAAQRARFNFKIDPKTPVKDLLPVPPTSRLAAGPVLEDDLARVPEVSFQEPFARSLPAHKATESTAHMIAKVNHVNQKKTDAFMEALLAGRADLSGLSFAMGNSCRMKQERSRHFQQALNTVRQAMGMQGNAFQVFTTSLVPTFTPAGSFSAPQPVPAPATTPPVPKERVVETKVFVPPPAPRSMPADDKGSRDSAETFWERYRAACLREDNANVKYESPHQEYVTLGRIAALMQVLAPESAAMRKGLVSYLATISHSEATRALAKLAIFSKERDVREAACTALKVRRERDYTEVLVSGLHYPWPAVAKHAAEAIVKLERKDLIPQLVTVLEQPDPRLPEVKNIGGKSVTAVRELVRVNHHRNCLMCHAPVNNSTVAVNKTFTEVLAQSNDGKATTKVVTSEVAAPSVSPDVLTAQVPVPGEPLPTPSQGYDNSQPDMLVRIDVTYLRQDFSEMQSVADAHPWPEKQRFDFLVRTRTLTEDQAQVYREKLSTREPGRVTPYQRVALAALRDLTGRDTEPTAQAWRRLLNLTERQGSNATQ